ncbi:MAG: hypothetical protein IJU39_00600 [Clostridia bacterium]|nr:hypothetical protein [Clostridia bacterium]
MSSEEITTAVSEEASAEESVSVKPVSKRKQKKFDKKQKKINKKQSKLDGKKSKAKKISNHKQKKFKKKQRKIDRKQRRLNKKGVKWGILPADILPEKKYNNFKEFNSYAKDKLYIENKGLRIFVQILCIIIIVAILASIIGKAISASAEKKWLEESYSKLETLNSQINDVIVDLGGEPTDESDMQAIQRKLDKIIKMLEDRNGGSSSAAISVSNEIDEVSSDLIELSDDTIGADYSTSAPSSSSSDSSAASSGSSVAPSSSSSTPPATKPASSGELSPSSPKKDIINYCNAALNKIKSSKAGFSKHYVMTVKGDVSGLPGWLVNLAKTDETTTVKKGESSNDAYPAAGYSWASKLTESDVKQATLQKSGSKYIIKLTIVEENNPAKGNSHFGRCMSVLDAEDVKAKSSLIKSADMHYYNGYIYAEIDIKTGHVIKSEASATADVKLNVSLLGDVQAKQIVSTETFTNFDW